MSEVDEVTSVIQVLVADDNAVIRLGLESLLSAYEDLQIVGTAVNGADALARARELQPDVVLLDVRMPGRDGLSVLAELTTVSRILMLTHSTEGDIISAALRSGAIGYLVHGSFTADELAAAVRDTAEGRSRLSPEAAEVVLKGVRGAAPPSADPAPGAHAAVRSLAGASDQAEPPSAKEMVTREVIKTYGLSPREVDILELIVRGHDNATIARKLFIEPKTVKNHVNRIFTKLRVSSRAQAIAVCLRLDG
jgi:DNA-binding NarL/FixJ family response regulator